jgi:hypothetical protein
VATVPKAYFRFNEIGRYNFVSPGLYSLTDHYIFGDWYIFSVNHQK